MNNNDNRKHQYAINKSRTAELKPVDDLTGYYLFNLTKLELKPVHPRKIKIHSIRLPYDENKNSLWINHKNYKVLECRTTQTDYPLGLLEFFYNCDTYVIYNNENGNTLIKKL